MEPGRYDGRGTGILYQGFVQAAGACGMDVCGEYDAEEDGTCNDRVNGMLLNVWKDWRDSHEK